MDDEFYEDDYEYYYEEEGDFFDSSDFEPYDELGVYPDPLLIAAVTCVFCLFIFGFLSKLTVRIFGSISAGSNLAQTSEQNSASPNQNRLPSWNGECQVSAHYPAKITRWCDLITKYSTQH